MKRPEAPWPHRIVHDTAYLFIPCAFAAFLLLLGGALLVSWGRLSNAVLVGFCVTAGLLIGFFIICHLALYCTSVRKKIEDKKKDDNSSSRHDSVMGARSVQFGSPRVCRSCLGGLSMHVPAVATFGGTTGRLEMQPVTEEAPDESEPLRPVTLEQRPQQTQPAIRNERQYGQQAAARSVGKNQQESQNRMEDELRTRFARPMSHLSATVPPLNLAHNHRNSVRSFYAFQNPASPHPDSKGGPGILIKSRSEQAIRPGLVASSVPPVVLSNNPLGTIVPPQPDGHPRIYDHSRSTTSAPVWVTTDRNPSPRTPPPRTALTARQRAQQTAPKIGSPLRQSHQYPYSPRDVGSPAPSRPRSRVPIGDIAQRGRVDVGPATSQQSHRPLPAHHEDAQRTMRNFETHVVRFRESDLAGLIASGVIKVNPESHPPDWMRKYAPSFSSHKADVEIFDNTERKTVELRHSKDSIRRNRSRRAEIESVACGGGRGYFSDDSGYCTASSGLISISTAGMMSRKREEESFQVKQPSLPPLWSRESSSSAEGVRRTLRRRSSVPELSTRFRVEREDEHEADDEASQGSSCEHYVWNEMGPLGIMARSKSRSEICQKY